MVKQTLFDQALEDTYGILNGIFTVDASTFEEVDSLGTAKCAIDIRDAASDVFRAENICRISMLSDNVIQVFTNSAVRAVL